MTESQEYAIGSLLLSTEMHLFLGELVATKLDSLVEDKPFTSLVEAFRFAFALGINIDARFVPPTSEKDISPRQFVVQEYQDLLLPIAIEEDLTLGKVASQFAEAGARAMHAHVTSTGGSVLQLVGGDEA